MTFTTYNMLPIHHHIYVTLNKKATIDDIYNHHGELALNCCLRNIFTQPEQICTRPEWSSLKSQNWMLNTEV